MTEKSQLVREITNHIRTAESVADIIDSVNQLEECNKATKNISTLSTRILKNQLACLHNCLGQAAEVVGVSIPKDGGLVIQSGQPKTKPGED